LIGINARIKASNQDIALVDEDLRLVDNDPSILLRSLTLKIQNFEVNRLNVINIGMLLNDITNTGKEFEEKMHEKSRNNKDMCIFIENRDYLEKCYEKFIYLFDRKKVPSGLVERNSASIKGKGYLLSN
jgi:hypothetical protein